MRNDPLHKLLLVTVLVASQWLAITHDYKHPALGDGEQSCQICLHGQNLQAGPAPALAPTAFWLTDQAPTLYHPDPVTVQRYTYAAIRAPPCHLV